MCKYVYISGKKKWHHDALLVSLEASPKCISFGHPRRPAQTCVFSVSLRCLPGISRVFWVSLEASCPKDCLLNWQNASRASSASEAQVTQYIFSWCIWRLVISTLSIHSRFPKTYPADLTDPLSPIHSHYKHRECIAKSQRYKIIVGYQYSCSRDITSTVKPPQHNTCIIGFYHSTLPWRCGLCYLFCIDGTRPWVATCMSVLAGPDGWTDRVLAHSRLPKQAIPSTSRYAMSGSLVLPIFSQYWRI